jgi:hypothetical protein
MPYLLAKAVFKRLRKRAVNESISIGLAYLKPTAHLLPVNQLAVVVVVYYLYLSP